MDSRYYDHSKLAEARKAKKLTQQDVATAVNVDRQTIYRAEAGLAVSYEVLVLMCQIYGLAMTEVIRPFPEPATAG